jgi:hypothetical protein
VRTCAVDAKIVGFLEVRFWLSRYSKRCKNFFDLAVFGVQVAAPLIDFYHASTALLLFPKAERGLSVTQSRKGRSKIGTGAELAKVAVFEKYFTLPHS